MTSTTAPIPAQTERTQRLRRFELSPMFGALLAACILALLAGLFLSRAALSGEQSISLGSAGPELASSFHDPELSSDGRGFRWTDGDSTIVLPAQSSGSHQLTLTLSAGQAANTILPMNITVNASEVFTLPVSTEIRRYSLLIGAEHIQASENRLLLESPTFAPPEANDPRQNLGVAVFEVGWHSMTAPAWLVPLQAAVIALTGGLLWLALSLAGLPRSARLLILLLFLAIALAMRSSDPRFLYRLHALFWLLSIALLCAAGSLALWLRRPAPAEPLPRLRPWLAQHWPAAAGYALLTLALLFPILPHFNTHIPGFPGDAYEYVWKMDWFARNLFAQQTSPTFAAHIFFPAGYEVALSEMTPAHTLLGAPLTWLGGPIASYNSLIVISFFLCGLFTYLTALRLGARPGAAFVAGLIVAFGARRFYHALGHLPMIGLQWAILALYGWEGVLTRRRNWDGFVAGLGFALAVWSSWYIGVTFALFLALYTPLRLGLRRLPELLAAWRPILLAALITLALVLPLAQPYFEVRSAGAMHQHSLVQMHLHSVRPLDYLLPSPYHALWGEWAGQFYPAHNGEYIVTLGITATLLALAALLVARQRRLTWTLLILALVNLAMTFGPVWYLPVEGYIPLPPLFVYHYVPILDSIRVWTRMALYISICAALLAAFTLSRIPDHWYRATWLLVAGLILIESLTRLPLSEPQPRPVDHWMHQHSTAQVLIEMPEAFSGQGLYYTTHSQKASSGGYASFYPPQYRAAMPILERFPAPETLALLQRWQVELIVVDEQAMQRRDSAWEERLAGSPVLERVYQAEGFSVYEFR